jgi:hypothetical protein
MRKPASRLNVASDFHGHQAEPVFVSGPIRFTTRRTMPWLFLASLAGLAVVGFAIVAILINSL